MSKARIITIACWCLTAVILIGLVVWFLMGKIMSPRYSIHINNPFSGISISSLKGQYNEAGSYSVPAGGIDALDVDWTAGAVTITPYDGSEIRFTEFAQRELEDREKLVYSVAGGTLEIDYIEPGFQINMITKELEVLVPASLADKLDRLSVDATSADLTISGFTVAALDIDETSGNTDITDLKADTAEISAVSGTIKINDASFSKLTAGTVSGEIELTGVTADTLTTDSTSGFQDLNGTFRNIDSGTVSGGIRINSTVDPDTITCGSTSGSITVTLPGSADLSVSYTTVSGRFTSEIPVRTGGGSAPYHFSTVSGSITLKAA